VNALFINQPVVASANPFGFPQTGKVVYDLLIDALNNTAKFQTCAVQNQPFNVC
jgi:hypothetical protein